MQVGDICKTLFAEDKGKQGNRYKLRLYRSDEPSQSVDLQQLDVEDQSAVGWDARKGLAAIGKVCWDGESTLATN